MTNKLEQMNIRLSESLKDKISTLAEKNNLKTSDFVRQTLEETIERKSREEDLNSSMSNVLGQERHILQAVAFIAHTDTGKPLIDCLKIALEVAEDLKVKDFADPTKITREEREQQALQINKLTSEKLGVTPLALSYIRLMITTYFGIIYNQEIFQATPLSLKTMEEIRDHLGKAK